MVSQTMFDPRTVAREIPGLFDSIFPQLTPGIVAYLNQGAEELPHRPVPIDAVRSCGLQQAMLFELGFAVGEQLVLGQEIDWQACFTVATRRQRQYFDAKLPEKVTGQALELAEIVGRNLASMLSDLSELDGNPISASPHIPGFEWISSGQGDFAIGTTLIEVKCTSRNFSSSDYRQIIIYWLLSFAASLERGGVEWTEGILLNPRSGSLVAIKFEEILKLIGAGSTKVEALQQFIMMVGSRLKA